MTQSKIAIPLNEKYLAPKKEAKKAHDNFVNDIFDKRRFKKYLRDKIVKLDKSIKDYTKEELVILLGHLKKSELMRSIILKKEIFVLVIMKGHREVSGTVLSSRH